MPSCAALLVCRYASVVTYVSHEKDAQGRVTVVHVRSEKQTGKPPKGVLNWVGQPAPGKEPPTAEARLYADAVCTKPPNAYMPGRACIDLTYRVAARPPPPPPLEHDGVAPACVWLGPRTA